MSSSRPTTIPADAAKRRALSDAITAYRTAHNDSLDKAALDLLNRLFNSSNAAKAFRQLKPQDRYLCRGPAVILLTCIEADHLARTFPHRIKTAEKMLAQIPRLVEAVGTLRKFVGQVFAESKKDGTFDLLTAPILEPSANIATMKTALDLIADRIDAEWRVAKEDMLRLGATQKRGAGNKALLRTARENAAIGWLAEGVRRVTGKMHLEAVRGIAQVLLQTELSGDRVRHAARSRDREWRQPLGKGVFEPEIIPQRAAQKGTR
jgi:hypothetical protein